jgi:uncharacterized membrane protein YeaQ/YmgE (transglycosylase-associated protein family)
VLPQHARTNASLAGPLFAVRQRRFFVIELLRDDKTILSPRPSQEQDMGIIWTIVIGFIAGVIAKFIMPGKNEPSGFVLTTILGIVGAVVASYLGHALGWYAPGEGAGLIGAVVGAIVVLFVWGLIAKRRV